MRHEQANRLEAGQGVHPISAVRQQRGIGELQRRHREDRFAIEAQDLAAGNQHFQARRGGEQLPDSGGCVHHLLEVVQQEQHALFNQVVLEHLRKRLATLFPNVEDLPDSRNDQGRVGHGGEGHKTDPVAKRRGDIRGSLQREPGLADSRWAGQRDDANLWAQQKGLEFGQFALAADQWGGQ